MPVPTKAKSRPNSHNFIRTAHLCVANLGGSGDKRVMRIILVPLALLSLSGCVVAEVVTAPIDAVTTTQSEADEDRGKALRQREERLGKLEREYREEREDCDKGDEDACAKAAEINEEIQQILPTIPADPVKDDD